MSRKTTDFKRKRQDNSDGNDRKKVKLDATEKTPETASSVLPEKVNKEPHSQSDTVKTTKKKIRKFKPKEKIQLPQASQEISANWKLLLQSGKVATSTKKPVASTKLSAKVDKKKPSSTAPASTHKPMAKSSEIWFDDVDQILLEPSKPDVTNGKDPLVKPYSYEGVTKVVGMDCEMVGAGDDGKDNILARVSLVNQYGRCIYDKFVKPTEHVTDYRTRFSGVRPSDLVHAEDFKTVQKEVSDLLLGRILVGHAIHNDLRVLFLTHPHKNIRDTSRYKPFRQLFSGGTPSLKKLTEKLLAVKVQEGEHNSVEDAQAAMRLYTLHRKEWEKTLKLCKNQRKNSLSDSIKLDS